MKTVKEQPESGQFVRIWEFDGKVWAVSVEWQDGKLMTFNPDGDHFFDADQLNPRIDYTFIVGL